jgi:hypothetical protein
VHLGLAMEMVQSYNRILLYRAGGCAHISKGSDVISGGALLIVLSGSGQGSDVNLKV